MAGINVTRYLGFGKETIYGTAVPGTQWIDPDNATIDPNGTQTIVYKGASGLDYIVAADAYTTSGAFSIPVDDGVFPYLLKWGLGNVASTGTGSITHTFTPATGGLMDPFTTHVGKDAFEHVMSGCAIDKMKFTLKRSGILTVDCDIVGSKDSKAAIASTTTYTTGNIFSAPDITVGVIDPTSTDISARVEEFTLQMNFNTDIAGGVTVGSRFPRKVFRGALDVQCSMTMSFNDTQELERFWGGEGAIGPVANTTGLHPFGVDFKIGANLDILMAKCYYDSVAQPLAGRNRIIQTAKLAVVRSTDGSTGPIAFALTNSKPVGTYA